MQPATTGCSNTRHASPKAGPPRSPSALRHRHSTTADVTSAGVSPGQSVSKLADSSTSSAYAPDTAAWMKVLAAGHVYRFCGDRWVLGDLEVRSVHVAFTGATRAASLTIPLKAVVEVRTVPYYDADCEAHVFDVKMRSGDAVRFRALDSFQQRDFADTMDDIAAGFRPHRMPSFKPWIHTMPPAAKAELPTQVATHSDQIAAVRAKAALPTFAPANKTTQLPELPRAPRCISISL